MNKSSRYLWFWVSAQACVVVAALGWRIHRGPLPYSPIKETHLEMEGGLKNTLEMFRIDCGRYPTSEEGFKALLTPPTNNPAGHWQGPYFDPPEIPLDLWRDPYVYRCPGIHNTNLYDLYSCGPDGISKSGGDDLDDINNWDPLSPHGGTFLDSSGGDAVFFKIMSALLIIPLFCAVRLMGTIFSDRIHASVARNRAVHIIWVITSLTVLEVFLRSLPPLVGR